MYFNDITNRLENPCLVFAEDIKILETAKCEAIEGDLDNVNP